MLFSIRANFIEQQIESVFKKLQKRALTFRDSLSRVELDSIVYGPFKEDRFVCNVLCDSAAQNIQLTPYPTLLYTACLIKGCPKKTHHVFIFTANSCRRWDLVSRWYCLPCDQHFYGIRAFMQHSIYSRAPSASICGQRRCKDLRRHEMTAHNRQSMATQLIETTNQQRHDKSLIDAT